MVVEAPMFQIILAALNAFLEQEQLNYDSLISFYDKTMGKDTEITLTQFTDLIELMTLKNTESEERLYPEVRYKCVCISVSLSGLAHCLLMILHLFIYVHTYMYCTTTTTTAPRITKPGNHKVIPRRCLFNSR